MLKVWRRFFKTRLARRLFANVFPSYNVRVIGRNERGKIVYDHRGKNIFLDVGRNWLLQLMSYNGTIIPGAAPPSAYLDNRVAFMGVGIGSREQTDQGPSGVPTIIYEGVHGITPTFLQDDTDVSDTGLEDPVAYSVYPGRPTDPFYWLKPLTTVEFPPSSPYTWVKYVCNWNINEINVVYATYSNTVPLSEAAIYPAELVGGIITEPTMTYAKQAAIAYEAFEPVNKLFGVTGLEIQWTFRM